uniref:Uncharacterized protein n=1 Tax=Trypanosoma congolense (strain IL3000) TaxID=1068625 RepID=G0UML7_TRYCI|nr:hypothetical protein, unlikely [Trypanosoma congolense IL3000]
MSSLCVLFSFPSSFIYFTISFVSFLLFCFFSFISLLKPRAFRDCATVVTTLQWYYVCVFCCVPFLVPFLSPPLCMCTGGTVLMLVYLYFGRRAKKAKEAFKEECEEEAAEECCTGSDGDVFLCCFYTRHRCYRP